MSEIAGTPTPEAAETPAPEVTTDSIIEAVLLSTDVPLPAKKLAELLGAQGTGGLFLGFDVEALDLVPLLLEPGLELVEAGHVCRKGRRDEPSDHQDTTATPHSLRIRTRFPLNTRLLCATRG